MSWPFEEVVSDAALEVLRSGGFRIGLAELPDLKPLRVAEDRYSILGLVGADTWNNVASELGQLPVSFSNWAAERGAGDRQWDLYLVVFLTDPITDEVLPTVEKFVIDTRFVRRVVRASMSHNREAVTDALAPFLPVDFGTELARAAPLEELTSRLIHSGMDEALVTGAIESYRSTGEVEIP